MTRLGLGVPVIPAKTAGDRFAEFFLLLAMLSATLGKIAQNIYNLQVTDVDEVTEFAEGKVGSTAMPHKLNPVASGSVVLLGRLLRARATRSSTTSTPSGRTTTARARPPGPSRRRCACCWGPSSRSARRLLGTLVVKPENMLRNLDRAGGVVLSEAVMMALAPEDRPRPRPRAGAAICTARPAARRGRSARRCAVHPEVRAQLTPARDRGRPRLPQLARPRRLLRGPRARPTERPTARRPPRGQPFVSTARTTPSRRAAPAAAGYPAVPANGSGIAAAGCRPRSWSPPGSPPRC